MLISTQACDWSWCWFTTESLQPTVTFGIQFLRFGLTQPSITASVISENYHGKRRFWATGSSPRVLQSDVASRELRGVLIFSRRSETSSLSRSPSSRSACVVFCHKQRRYNGRVAPAQVPGGLTLFELERCVEAFYCKSCALELACCSPLALFVTRE